MFFREIYKKSCETLFCRAAVLDDADGERTEDEGDAGNHHHVALYGAHQMKQYAAYRSSDDLRYADGAVEESEVCPHVTNVNGMASMEAQAQPMRMNGRNSRYWSWT